MGHPVERMKKMNFGRRSRKLPDTIGVCVAGEGRDNAENFDLKDYKEAGTVGYVTIDVMCIIGSVHFNCLLWFCTHGQSCTT